VQIAEDELNRLGSEYDQDRRFAVLQARTAYTDIAPRDRRERIVWPDNEQYEEYQRQTVKAQNLDKCRRLIQASNALLALNNI
jgi:hypothetical protein